MSNLLNSEVKFYFNELHRTKDEAVKEFYFVLKNNLHNKDFDVKEAQQKILRKYFPEAIKTTH